MAELKPREIYGAGLSFPPRVGADGRLAWSSGEQNVRESLRIILMTEPGERLMRERFGCGLRRFLAEPNTVTTRELIRGQVESALGRWEPRVKVREIRVTVDRDDPRAVNLHVIYELIATGASDQLDLSLTLEG